MYKRIKCICIIAIISIVAMTALSACASCSGNPAHVHEYGDWIEVKAPTCEESGVRIKSCECGDEIAIDIPALGHELKQVSAKSATCTEAGKKVWKCTSCEENESISSPALGHDFELVNSTASTCTDNGREEFKCTQCDEGYVDVLPLINHEYDDYKVTNPPTCTLNGAIEGVCKLCGDITTVEISPLGHDYFTIEVLVDPTCFSTGTERAKCSRCGDITEREGTDFAHKFETVEVIAAATCIEGGEEYARCSICKYEEQHLMPALGHDIPDNFIRTETEHFKVCNRCNLKIVSENHTFYETRVEPTCEDDGLFYRACSQCGQKEGEEILSSLGHSGVWEIISSATCTKEGFKIERCSVCNIIVSSEILPLVAHSLVIETKQASCTEAGYTLKSCSECDYETIEEFLPALGHNAGNWETITEATCTEDGIRQKSCTVCGILLEIERSFASGHSFTGDGVCDKCGVLRFEIRINYIYADTYTKAADSVTIYVLEGQNYSVPSPQIIGFVPDRPVVEGVARHNDTIIVRYSIVDNPATDLTVDVSELKLTVGQAAKITATVKPSNATNRALVWKSENSLVASVNDGVITAIKAGTVTITVSTIDGAKWVDIYVIVVDKEPERIVDVWDGSKANFAGTGTQTDPFVIASASQLAFLAQSVNSGTKYGGKYFKLTSDIDLNNIEWTAIGNCEATDINYSPSWTNVFSGHFNGNGHIIYNLKIGGSIHRSGLFGVVAGGSISSLTIKSADIDVDNDTMLIASVLCAQAVNAKIERCGVYGTVNASYSGSGSSYAGGLVGLADNATIENCFGVATLGINNFSGSYNAFVGGLVGGLQSSSHVEIQNCYFSGTVNASSAVGAYAAGILGTSGMNTSGSIKDCFVVGSITANGNSAYVDAVHNYWISETLTIENCYYNAKLKAGNDNVSSKHGSMTEELNLKSPSWLKATLGWDFDNVWQFDMQNEYPILRF